MDVIWFRNTGMRELDWGKSLGVGQSKTQIIFRHSGRTLDDPVEDVTCTDDKTMDIQTKFQTCSHSTATSVYQTIQDITSVKSISDKLCKALTTIGTVCVKHLNECFAEDDVRQMRKSHLEEMKTFLLRISQEK